MGTRGAIGFILDDALVATYNHFDSYPDGLGTDMVRQANAMVAEKDDTVAKCRALTRVSASDTPSPEILNHFAEAGIQPENVSTGSDWYSLLRSVQGNLLTYLRLGFMPDDTNFLKDSLFCEYAYLVDLDRDVLICLEGFNENPDAQWDRIAIDPNDPWEPDYAGQKRFFAVRLVGELPLPASEDDLLALYEPDDA